MVRPEAIRAQAGQEMRLQRLHQRAWRQSPWNRLEIQLVSKRNTNT